MVGNLLSAQDFSMKAEEFKKKIMVDKHCCEFLKLKIENILITVGKFSSV